MIGLPFAHIAGIPVEETLASYGPALLIALGAAAAMVRAHLRRLRFRRRKRASRGPGEPTG